MSKQPEQRRAFSSRLDPWPAAALWASLGIEGPAPSLSLPLLWHWLYFLEAPSRDQQGGDGHPRPGGFLPVIEQPRRMFVGGRCRLHRHLQLGVEATMEESVLSCQEKQGSAGAMTLLTVAYHYQQRGALCIEEERDFMYLPARDAAAETACQEALAPVPEAHLALNLDTDPVLLFKFSALTFNGHRIHYDGDYARNVEGYPGPVVHGPLTALLLALLATDANPGISQFAFRARAPLYCGDRLRLRGDLHSDKHSGKDRISLTAYRPDGQVAMTAEANE